MGVSRCVCSLPNISSTQKRICSLLPYHRAASFGWGYQYGGHTIAGLREVSDLEEGGVGEQSSDTSLKCIDHRIQSGAKLLWLTHQLGRRHEY
jgi:hypothetical protein